jgi:hypothetical protein
MITVKAPVLLMYDSKNKKKKTSSVIFKWAKDLYMIHGWQKKRMKRSPKENNILEWIAFKRKTIGGKDAGRPLEM